MQNYSQIVPFSTLTKAFFFLQTRLIFYRKLWKSKKGLQIQHKKQPKIPETLFQNGPVLFPARKVQKVHRNPQKRAENLQKQQGNRKTSQKIDFQTFHKKRQNLQKNRKNRENRGVSSLND